VCRFLAKIENGAIDLEAVKTSVEAETTIDELIAIHNDKSEKEVLKAVQILLDNNELVYLMNGKISPN
jgi:uncharacterized iron-regulated protein